MNDGEVRIVSSTGGAKGQKPQRMDLIPWGAVMKISEIYGFGADKYDDHNWRRGYDFGLSFGAMMRHLALFWEGEDNDKESGLSHLAHAGFHIFALLEGIELRPQFDNRWATSQVEKTEGKVHSKPCPVNTCSYSQDEPHDHTRIGVDC